MTLVRGGFPGCNSQKMKGQGLSVLTLENSWQQPGACPHLLRKLRIVVGSLTIQHWRIPERIAWAQNWTGHCSAKLPRGRAKHLTVHFWPIKQEWSPLQNIMETLGTLSFSLRLCINHPFPERTSYWWEWVRPSLITHCLRMKPQKCLLKIC